VWTAGAHCVSSGSGRVGGPRLLPAYPHRPSVEPMSFKWIGELALSLLAAVAVFAPMAFVVVRVV